MKPPCTKDCRLRTATCHCSCELYQRWHAENEKKRLARIAVSSNAALVKDVKLKSRLKRLRRLGKKS